MERKISVLKKIRKNRNLTLRDLYLKINQEINLSRLSDIDNARKTITKDEIEILNKYIDLTNNEIEDLEDMELDELLIEQSKIINELMSLVPKELKAGESIIKTCPNCGAELTISKAKINGHLWIVCAEEGVLICQ